jgi:hypothetical protein
LQSKEREIDILEQENQSIETKIIHATPRIPNKMDRKKELITRSTQTRESGSSTTRDKKKIKQLKRRLKEKTVTQDLMSLMNLQTVPLFQQQQMNLQQQQQQQQQLHQQIQSLPVPMQIHQQQLMQQQVQQQHQIDQQERAQRHYENQHYERTRKLLDSHNLEIKKLKETYEEERRMKSNELNFFRKKVKDYKKKNNELRNSLKNVVSVYQSKVNESQNKALECCEEFANELEVEKSKNSKLLEQIQSMESLNIQLQQSLNDTMNLFEESKHALLHQTLSAEKDRNRFTNVMNVLAESTSLGFSKIGNDSELRMSTL